MGYRLFCLIMCVLIPSAHVRGRGMRANKGNALIVPFTRSSFLWSCDFNFWVGSPKIFSEGLHITGLTIAGGLSLAAPGMEKSSYGSASIWFEFAHFGNKGADGTRHCLEFRNRLKRGCRL